MSDHTYRLRKPFYVGLTCLLMGVVNVNAQQMSAPADSGTTQRGPYTIVVTAGSGLSYYVRALGVPTALEQARIRRLGTPASVRVMWYPDHRLRVGLETGRLPMYRYQGRIGSEQARVAVSTVPVLLIFSMPLSGFGKALSDDTDRSLSRRLALTAGTGVYLNRSYLSYVGTVQNNTVSLGWMVAGSYTHPIGRRFWVAAELKWFDALVVENAALTAELQLVWRAFSW